MQFFLGILATLGFLLETAQASQNAECVSRGINCFCNANLYTGEDVIIKEVQTLIQSQQPIKLECLQILSGRGYYRAALKLFEQYFLMNQIDVSDRMRSVTATNRRNLESLITTMMSSKSAVQNVRPVMQWAQNKDNIFINLKLAMRQDSPACLVCKMEVVNITDERLYLSFYGVYSHQPLRFELDFLFDQPINSSQSTWKLQSVGTLFFNLAKQTKGELWLDLEQNQSKQIPIWWDMRDNHQKDMDQWIEKLEERENERDNAKQNQQKKEKEEQLKKQTEDQQNEAAQEQQNTPTADEIKPEEPQSEEIVVQKKEDI